MQHRFFKSDNTASVCPEVMTALAEVNSGPALPYGTDEHSERLDGVFGELFGAPVRVFTVLSGTAANSLALATLVPPWGAVLTHAEAHIERDECGAPEFFTGGARLSLVSGDGAKLTRDALAERLKWFDAHVHSVQPRAVSLTQATERGAVYSAAELQSIADLAHANNMALHMDGARFANAVVALGCAPADITWRAGVDVLSFGAVKNGGMNAEAVVFFQSPFQNNERLAEFEFRRKRAGHLACKGRYFSAQLLGLIESGAWRRNAERANRLAGNIARTLGERLTVPCTTNQVFARLGDANIAALSQQGFAFYPWGPAGSGEARFVVSWDTPERDVDALCAALTTLVARNR
jgi:threonine aldolase